MADNFADWTDGLDSPARHAVAVTPHDSNNLSVSARALYIGAAGNISVETVGGESAVVFVAIPAGTVLPLRVSRVNNTATTASSIVALY